MLAAQHVLDGNPGRLGSLDALLELGELRPVQLKARRRPAVIARRPRPGQMILISASPIGPRPALWWVPLLRLIRCFA